MSVAMDKKLVSIIVPTYNHAAELRKALASIFAQTYTPSEVIVVDDGSGDETREVVAEFDHIQYIVQTHAGAPAARNNGFAASKGSYVIFWDADVVGKKEMLQKMVSVLEENPRASYVYSSFRFGWKKFVCGPFDPEKLRKTNYITTTTLIRREDFFGFDETLCRFQDWDIWLTLLKEGKIGVWIPEMLFWVHPRVSGKGISAWLPSWVYRLPFKTKTVRSYEQARAILFAKHGL